MAHYVAIIEDAGPDHAVGVSFPDLPGCTSAGDDIDDALRNAPEALELYVESFAADGKPMPRPRTLTELKTDPEIADDIRTYMVALIEFPARARAASAGKSDRVFDRISGARSARHIAQANQLRRI